MQLLRHLRHRPRLLIALALGVVALAWPQPTPWSVRGLLGWNVGVWAYIALMLPYLLRADGAAVQQRAREQAEGGGVILLVAILGAACSVGAITLELRQAAELGIALTIGTVIGSWLLLPLEFAVSYASLYHRGPHGPHGLEFPGADGQPPDFSDFLYFAVTLATTSQTSDVTVSSRPMRRLVLLHAVVAFVFNTSVLALLINILAGMVKP
ncbi:DUF1345 domain-containing protein [Roseateles paludis]|jgi:uncharacterized membrane protein|uniref:DUF1345 domain-containing protein n=1 Tax=Roseateles paludis TaxID=3145238 RepID=A0ABV0G596_9BURK